MYNMDKKDNALEDTSTTKVITNVENKAPFSTNTSNWEWLSIAEFISGDGEKNSLYVTFKRQQIKPTWTELLNIVHSEASKWSGIEMTGKRWTTNEVGFPWLKETFTPWGESWLRNTYCILIIDSQRSHVSLEFIEYYTQNQIVALCLSPHTNHILQILNVRIFSSLANAYKLLIEKKCRYGNGWSVDKTAFWSIISKLVKKSFCRKNSFSIEIHRVDSF